MSLDNVSKFFRNSFSLANSFSLTNNGIKVWMPVFVNEVNDNTSLLLRQARQLEASAERIRARNRAREEERKNKSTESSIRRYYSAFLEYF